VQPSIETGRIPTGGLTGFDWAVQGIVVFMVGFAAVAFLAFGPGNLPAIGFTPRIVALVLLTVVLEVGLLGCAHVQSIEATDQGLNFYPLPIS
jgi:hypothetical protein